MYIVVPCYNEENVLPITAPMFKQKLYSLIESGEIHPDSRILFVNDGSKDQTWPLIKKYAAQDKHFLGISQSRNRGHQSSVLAGLMEAKDLADITISIDADGQDDLNAMDEMVKAYANGAEIVYGVRSSRDTDTFFKRFTAETFYKFLNKMGANVIYNHADYRLVSSRVLNEFSNFKEVNLFLRGMFPLVGFNSTSVYYKRQNRLAGESHYPLKKMIALAIDGITSLSIKPLQLISALGIIFSIGGFIAIMWALIMHIIGHTLPGWTSLICLVCFMGGIQLISIGILGEYIGKIYLETKQRPRYIISERTNEIHEKDTDLQD